MHPGDSFLQVLLLLLFQYQLYEQLLQLLIAIVDTELLKAGNHMKNSVRWQEEIQTARRIHMATSG